MKALTLFAFVAIGAFELFVLWLAKSPQVPDGYRAYYMEQSAICLRPGHNYRLKLDDSLSFDKPHLKQSCDYIRAGWAPPSFDGLWSDGEEAWLWLPLDEQIRLPATLRLTLWGYAPDTRFQQVEVYANDIPLGTLNLMHNREMEASLLLPPQAAGDNAELKLRFKVSNPSASVQGGKAAHLGFGLGKLSLLPPIQLNRR